MDFTRLASLIDHLEEIYGIPNCDLSIFQDHRLAMFFAMSVGNMVTVKQIHHKIRDLMYEGLGM